MTSWQLLVRLTGSTRLAAGLDDLPLRESLRRARRRVLLAGIRRRLARLAGFRPAPSPLATELSAGRQALADALARLAFGPRAMVLLVDAAGQPIDEAADALGVDGIRALRDLNCGRAALRRSLLLDPAPVIGRDPVLGPALRALRHVPEPVASRELRRVAVS